MCAGPVSSHNQSQCTVWFSCHFKLPQRFYSQPFLVSDRPASCVVVSVIKASCIILRLWEERLQRVAAAVPPHHQKELSTRPALFFVGARDVADGIAKLRNTIRAKGLSSDGAW